MGLDVLIEAQRNVAKITTNCMYVWMDGWMHGWMHVWMDAWMHECMDACMHVCVLFLPLAAEVTTPHIVQRKQNKTHRQEHKHKKVLNECITELYMLKISNTLTYSCT